MYPAHRLHPDTRCERCFKETLISICSMFTTQQICMECKKVERAHPDYEKAREAEAEACRNGNYNFPGIGLPADL